jgi:microcystin-dependent protein
MASSYTTSLKIQEIGNGEQAGVWGSTTNTNWQLIEQAVAGVQTITMTNANYTLTNLNGVLDEARNMVLVVQGTNSGIYQVVAPLNQPKMYVVSNQTSGGYAITIGASSGSVITIPNGVTAQVYTDGTNFYSAQTGSAGNFTVNGTLTASGVTDTGSLSAASLSVSGASTFSTSPTAPTPTTGDNTTKIATTAFVTTAVANTSITGQILMWPTASAPSGYLNCDGSAVSRTTYSALYAVVGTTFGTGDGSTTFNLPNYQDRMPIGKGTIAASIGATGGSATTTISQANLPNVSFPVTDPGHQHNTSVTGSLLFPATGATTIAYGGSGTYPATRFTMDNNTTGITVNSGGSGTAATTISPYLGINFIIKT